MDQCSEFRNSISRSSHCGARGLAELLQHQDAGSIPGRIQWVKDLELLLRLWLWSDFWPRNSIWYGAAQKEKNQFLGPWSLYFDPWSKERHKSLVRDCGGWGGLTTHTCPECPGSIISQAFTVMTKHNHCCHNEESIKHSYGPPSHSSLALKIIPLFKLLN